VKKVKALAYIRVGTDTQQNGDRQRAELVAKFGDTHEIVAEYRDDASGNLGVGDRPGLEKLLEDAAKGEFDVLLCTDLSRLARLASPEIIMALRDAGVRVVTVDGAEIGEADLVV
jgi:DNA invertase Pin-like site-specific DNA recombinase